jgi:hypothetical protein
MIAQVEGHTLKQDYTVTTTTNSKGGTVVYLSADLVDGVKTTSIHYPAKYFAIEEIMAQPFFGELNKENS